METFKQVMTKTIAILMALVLIIGIAPMGSFAGMDFSKLVLNAKTLDATGDDVSSYPSSAVAPKNYVVKKSGGSVVPRTVDDTEEFETDVLLIQDNLPWDSKANEYVLSDLNINYKKITTSQLSTENLWDYKMIVIANDQTFSTYNNFKTFKSNIDLFANLGGVIVFGASDSGWANGDINFDLPGGLKKFHEYAYNNYIIDSEHPIVTGELTDGTVLQTGDLESNYCSHGYFDESTLPGGTNVIFRSSDSDGPTLIEYPYGSGHIIASTLTWEHNYSITETFAPIAMDDLFAYAYSLCDGTADSEKMQIARDNNSFIHTGSSFFTGSEAQQYQIDTDLFNRLTSYYDEEQLQWESLPNVRQLVQKQRVSKWGGSCYGISVSMALTFVNEIDIKNFYNTASVYYEAKQPKTNPRFRSLINYYQLSQYLPAIDKKSVDVYASNQSAYTNGIKTVVKMAQQSERSGYPFIFTFGYKWYTNKILFSKMWESAGHAIVCVGCEETDKGYRLQFVDPNNITDYIYANVPADYSSINFETTYNAKHQLENSSRKDWQITRIGYDTLTLFKSIDIDGADNNSVGITNPRKRLIENYSLESYVAEDYDVILFNSDTAFTLTADDGTQLIFDGAGITGDMEIISTNYYERGDSVDFQLAVKSHASYDIEQSRDDIDITIYNSNEDFYAFVGKGSKAISFDMDEGVSASGDKMDCSVFCGVDNENVDMVQISNAETDSLAVVQDDNDLVVESNNVSDVAFTGFFENDITEIEIEKDETENTIVVDKEDIHIHNYEITRVEATCTEDGKVDYVCECGYSYTEVLKALGHTHASWVIDKKATVNAPGSKHSECSVCGIVETVVIPQLKCSKPALKSVTNTSTGVKITWKKVSGADSYIVYRRTASGKFKKIGTTKTTSYTDKKAKRGTSYYYTVKATNEAGSSLYHKTGFGIKRLSASTVKSVTNVANGVTIKWSKVSGASGYYVYCKVGSGKYVKIKTIKKGSTVTFTDKSVKSGKKYSYYVKAYSGKSISLKSNACTIKCLADPVLKTPTSAKKGITLKWSKVIGAQGYVVYRKKGNGSYKKLDTVKGVSKVSYLDKSAKKNNKYTYKVKAYYGKTNSAYSNAKTIKDKY